MLEASAPPVAFRLAMEVDASDIDELGHASNIAYVRWIQHVAVAHSAAVGLDVAAYQSLGAVFVVRRHEVDYLRPVLRGERLELRTWIHSVNAAKCQRATQIVRLAAGEQPEKVIANALTTWGYIEIATGRPIRIPPNVREAFGFSPKFELPKTS